MDVTGKRVLIFGDSLTHRGSRASADGRDVTEGVDRDSSPGDLLASQLLVAGASSARINGRVSRSAWNFFHGGIEDGEGILAAEASKSPDVVFVFLGTNDMGLNTTRDAEAFETIRSTFANAGAEVWSIGPPYFASDKHTADAKTVYKTLRKVFGADRVIDLRPLSSDVKRTSDGVHFPGASARIVAARLASAIAELGDDSIAVVKHVKHAWKPIGISIAGGFLFVGLAWIIRRRRKLAR
jgi:lysophospholipase L1-like esterase